MANFNLNVQPEAFERLGVKPFFDENLYGELLDNLAPGTGDLEVHFRPHINWGIGTMRSALRQTIALYAGDHKQMQTYRTLGSFDKDNKVINVFGTQNVESTNGTLLHETKHLIDLSSGDFEEGLQWARGESSRILKRGAKASLLAGVATGALVGIGSGDEFTAGLVSLSVGVTSLTGSLALANRIPYKNSPHEIAAREFELEPDILREYGSIIRYGQLA